MSPNLLSMPLIVPHFHSEQKNVNTLARFSRPHPISTLQQQIITLRGELDNRRQKYKIEHKEMEGQHGSELQHIQDEKGDVEGGFRALQEKYKRTMEGLLKKVNDMESNWTTLQMRVGALNAEVDALRTAAAVQTTPSRTCLEIGDANKQVEESQASNFGGPDWHRMDAGKSKELETNMGRLSKNAGGRESTRLEVADAEPLSQQRAFETEVTVQDVPPPHEGCQADVLQSQELTKKLQQRNTELEAIRAGENAEITCLRLQNAAYHELLKELVDSNRILKTHSQNHSKLVLKVEDILQLGGPSIEESFAPTRNGEVSDVPRSMREHNDSSTNDRSLAQTPNGGSHSMVAVPRNSSYGVSTGAHTVNIMETSQAAGLKARKRTLSELVEDTREASLMEHQRRRTGFASYVGLSNHAWKEGAAPIAAGKGFGSVHGDFDKNLKLRAPSSVNLRSHRSGIASLVENTAPGSAFAATKEPLEISSSQDRASVYLPKESPQGPEVASGPSHDTRAPSRVFHFRSNTQGQSPWKVPVGPRKWQNSALRK